MFLPGRPATARMAEAGEPARLKDRTGSRAVLERRPEVARF